MARDGVPDRQVDRVNNPCGAEIRSREPKVLAGAGSLDAMRYFFGIYHWQRRMRRLCSGIAAIATGVLTWRFVPRPLVRVVAAVLIVAGIRRARGPVQSMLTPPPWAVRTAKYRALAQALAIRPDERVLDLGCGSGRSLVGLADRLPVGSEVIGLDVFDDRVILGNGPRLAMRNARTAGLAPGMIAGDAARLPLAADSVDAITACRLLHDLPKTEAESALAECNRVLAPDGRLGVLELQHTHDAEADPDEYWRAQLAAAGFTVQSGGATGVNDGYLRYIATGDPDA